MAARPPKTAPSAARTPVRRSVLLMQLLLLALAAAASALKAPARGGIPKMMLQSNFPQQQHTHSSYDETASLGLKKTDLASSVVMDAPEFQLVASDTADAVKDVTKDELLLSSDLVCCTRDECIMDGDAVDAHGGDGPLAMPAAHSETIALLLKAGASDELQESSGNACMVVGQTGAGRTSSVSIKYLGTPTQGRQMVAALWLLPPTPRYSCGRGKIICNVGPLPPRVQCSVQPSTEEEEEAYQVACQLFADACVEADARVFTYDRGGDVAAPDASKKDDAAIAIVYDASKPVVQSFAHLPFGKTVTVDVKLGVEVMRERGSPLRCRSTQVQNCEKVLDVKCVIKDKAGIPVEEQRLYCEGKLLEDGSQREDCIKKHSNIYLVHGLLGGMPASDRPRRAAPAPAPAAAPALVPLDVRIPAELDQIKTTTLGILRDHYQKKDEDEDWEQLSFPDLRGMLRGRIQFKGLKSDAVLNGFIKGWAADYLKRFGDEEEMPEREYWEALNIESAVRKDHLSAAVVGAKEKAVEVWGSVAKILRECLAWRKPEIVNGDELKLGGHLEDGTCKIVKAYKCADVANEKKLWAATSKEEEIIKRECARLAAQDQELVAVCVCDQPGQSAVDLPIYVCEKLREALAKHEEFAHLAGPARAVAVHVRTGKARLAFSGVSHGDEKDEGEERLSVFTGVATTHHEVTHSERTENLRERKPLPTHVPGQDVKTGVQCWDEDESSPVEYVDGVVLYLSGEFDVGTGDYGPGFARMQTTIDERTDGTPKTVYSPAAAEVLNACDTSLEVERVTGPTVVNRRECSIGAALLCVACGVGDLFKCVRRYHVDAFKTWPYLLADEMYNDRHCVELDNTLELVYLMEGYYGVNVRFSGASREDSEDAAFDIVLEKSDDPHCPILMLRKRDVIVEIKNEHAKLLRKKLRAGHGKAEVESDSDSEKKKEKDPSDEEKPKGRGVRADKVDVTISFRPTRTDSPHLFGPGRSEAAAVMRHKRQELIDESRAEDASLSLEEAMRRAAEKMWKTSGYRYRGVVCAAAHLHDDSQPSCFNVDPDVEKDVAAAIANAFNTEIARNDKAMGGKHDGEARHAIKKLDTAELPNLQEAKSKLVAAFDKANGNVVTPHGAPWAGLVAAIDAEAAEALETKVAELVKELPPDRAIDLAAVCLPYASDARVHQHKGVVDSEAAKRPAAPPAAPAPEAASPAAAAAEPAPMNVEPVSPPAPASVPRAAAAARPAAAKPSKKRETAESGAVPKKKKRSSKKK